MKYVYDVVTCRNNFIKRLVCNVSLDLSDGRVVADVLNSNGFDASLRCGSCYDNSYRVQFVGTVD